MSAAERDERFMRRAIEVAMQGRYTAHPNPIVGAVIVRDDREIASGFHARAGGPHAERSAIAATDEELRGATLYVTLEPCSHHGRTAPCSSAVVEAGFARVVIGMIDPNPLVSGRGVAELRAAGISVEIGTLGGDCWSMNEDFVISVLEGRPMVTAKIATSLDGRIATRTGSSQWITGPVSRRRVHEMRRDHNAILVGRNTLLTDDPSLTTRLPDAPQARSPHRFVLDARLEAPLSSKVFDVSEAKTTVVCGRDAPAEARAALAARGVDVLEVPRDAGGLSLSAVLGYAHSLGYTSVLAEGGGAVVGSLLDAGLVDRLAVFTAPVVIGGVDAIPGVGGRGAALMSDATRAHSMRVERLGDDVLMVADLSPHLVPKLLG